MHVLYRCQRIRTFVPELQPTRFILYCQNQYNSGHRGDGKHNPPEYNGYKVYWSDGAQVPPPMDSEIIHEVSRVKGFEAIRIMDEGEALKNGLLCYIGEETVSKYIERVKELCINKSIVAKAGRDLKIIYTFTWSGNKPVRQVLKQLSQNVTWCPSRKCRIRFSTVGYPNLR